MTAPFLRWAGGKSWLLKHLDHFLPPNGFKNYHEPFLGSGAIFLHINPPKHAFLSDLNKELIETFCTLRDKPEKVILELKKYKNEEEFYYKTRDAKCDGLVESAARFIYLNQTSYNGIYRVNLKGEYNVPYGHRAKNFLEEDKIRAVSVRLKNATFFHGDFEQARENIKKGDLVFLDPPYVISHNENGFIKYNKKLFSLEDQHRLASFIDFVKRKNACFILTNADHPKIRDIFGKEDRAIQLSRANLIGGLKARRGQTTELLFTNIKGSES